MAKKIISLEKQLEKIRFPQLSAQDLNIDFTILEQGATLVQNAGNSVLDIASDLKRANFERISDYTAAIPGAQLTQSESVTVGGSEGSSFTFIQKSYLIPNDTKTKRALEDFETQVKREEEDALVLIKQKLLQIGDAGKGYVKALSAFTVSDLKAGDPKTAQTFAVYGPDKTGLYFATIAVKTGEVKGPIKLEEKSPGSITQSRVETEFVAQTRSDGSAVFRLQNPSTYVSFRDMLGTFVEDIVGPRRSAYIVGQRFEQSRAAGIEIYKNLRQEP